LFTIGTLPAAIRRDYGFSWSSADARALARWTLLLRTSRRLLPPAVRDWPIARRRASAAAAGAVGSDTIAGDRRQPS
jgi:uncharacterized protein (DUF2236 family)